MQSALDRHTTRCEVDAARANIARSCKTRDDASRSSVTEFAAHTRPLICGDTFLEGVNTPSEDDATDSEPHSSSAVRRIQRYKFSLMSRHGNYSTHNASVDSGLLLLLLLEEEEEGEEEEEVEAGETTRRAVSAVSCAVQRRAARPPLNPSAPAAHMTAVPDPGPGAAELLDPVQSN
ncbi:hypothetical protein EYF80_054757 [Liparis tanakae]|uniref:Uncharacterized protein n=1 Tax=Liparis tanakae TaxID=230148 RepID=A0A4Z2F206_9TELE|nr:hypothetical protein EYF80_054757 [Liparis tanakae]